ncbi:MAG: hypothetical protein AAFW73_26830, partial [Bacteroidota bacterium]
MRFRTLFLGLGLYGLGLLPLAAQVHIDANEDVGVGTTNTDPAKLRLDNPDNHYGLYITQRSSIPNGNGNCAIYSEVTAEG